MKKILTIIFLTIAAIALIPGDAEAQYGKKKKRRGEEEEVVTKQKSATSLMNNLWYGVNIGNPGITNTFFSLGVGPMAAYKFNNALSAGVITNFELTYLWGRFSPNETYIDYSLGVFGRARFLQSFYAHAEYNLTSLDRATTAEPRSNFPVLFLGGGYSSGRAPWGWEATLLYDVLGNLARFRIPIVYRIGITYNF